MCVLLLLNELGYIRVYFVVKLALKKINRVLINIQITIKPRRSMQMFVLSENRTRVLQTGANLLKTAVII